jgi:hypothetical protein
MLGYRYAASKIEDELNNENEGAFGDLEEVLRSASYDR